MAGIYIHIPFCRSRCIYCGFYSTTGLELRQRYVDALCKEMMIRGEKLEVSGERIDIETIYFGGGTPSQLTIPQLNQLLIYINKVYSLTSHHSPLTSDLAVYVGDSDVDLETANNSGLPCISVLWGFRDRDFLIQHGAKTFISAPSELL